ncbi:MAG: hypothetical protein RL145_1545 [Pseudomonadota bacterium]|jgi:hypothetical protein
MPLIVFVNMGRGAGLGWGWRVFVGVGPVVALAMIQRLQPVSQSQLLRHGDMAIGS